MVKSVSFKYVRTTPSMKEPGNCQQEPFVRLPVISSFIVRFDCSLNEGCKTGDAQLAEVEVRYLRLGRHPPSGGSSRLINWFNFKAI